MGQGYVFLIAAVQGARFPEQQFVFINRGMGGNTTGLLAGRWQIDALDLKPDVVSILIGVNDVVLPLRTGQSVDIEDYEKRYDKLLADTMAALPGVKLILGEPFFGKGYMTALHLQVWQTIMPQVRAVVARLGEKYHAPVVHYQQMFDDALKRAPLEYWIWDGVHPTYSGHQLMADEWQKVYRRFMACLKIMITSGDKGKLLKKWVVAIN